MHPLSRSIGFMGIGAAVLGCSWMTLSLVHTAPTVARPAGLEDVLAKHDIVLIGEFHGTQESPQFVADAASLGLEQGRSVTVALEIPRDEGPILQAYLESPSPATSRRSFAASTLWNLLDGPGSVEQDPPCRSLAFVTDSHFWRDSFQDGRSSVAMCRLITQLHGWRLEGRPVHLLTIDAPEASPANDFVGPQVPRDEVMAKALTEWVESPERAFHGDRPELLLVLTGNLHQRLERGSPWNKSYESMGLRLARRLDRFDSRLRLAALDIRFYGGGSAWICSGSDASTCGLTSIPRRSQDALPEERSHACGVTLLAPLAANRSRGYYYFCVAVHAAPPAVQPRPAPADSIPVAAVRYSGPARP